MNIILVIFEMTKIEKGVGGSDWSVKKISIVLCKFINASILIYFLMKDHVRRGPLF